MRVVSGLVMLILCVWGSTLPAPADDMPTVRDYLRAYIYQKVKMIDGEPATAAFVAVERSGFNGLDALTRVDPEVADVVFDALSKDRESHVTEYAARRHIANGESLGPNREWDPAAVQRNLWARFLGDERWLRRVLLLIRETAERRGVNLEVEGIPPEQLLVARATDVERISRILGGYSVEEAEVGCGRNPLFALREARGEDPMLVAAIYEIGGSSVQNIPAERMVDRLRTLGWQIEE